jgi:hypothetical protein
VTLYLRAARAAVRRLPDLDEERRADVAATVEEIAHEQPSRRWSELGGLLWLGVTLRSRADTGGVPAGNWLQGVHRGGALLLAASAVDRVAFAGASRIGVGAAVALGLIVAVWAAVTDRRPVALALVGVAAVLLPAAGDGVGTATWTRLAVAAAALAIGAAPAREQGRMCPWRWMVAVGAACCLVQLAPATRTVVAPVATALVPAIWLGLSRADPRLAVGAATVLSWRLVAVDLHELGAALVALPSDLQVDRLLARWTFMALGAGAAFWAANTSIRRATRL